jgi:hypothetical protein
VKFICPILNTILMCQYNLLKLSNTKLHENPFQFLGPICVVMNRQTKVAFFNDYSAGFQRGLKRNKISRLSNGAANTSLRQRIETQQ